MAMRLQIRFVADETTIHVDTTNGTCAVFDGLTATEAARALEEVGNLPPDVSSGEPTNWHMARIGGEWCYVMKLED